MPSLFNEEKIQVFRCPNCSEYIASDSERCRFCSTLISLDMKQSKIEQEKSETKKANRKTAFRHLGIGGLIFLAGLVVFYASFAAASSSERGNLRIILILLVGGGMDFLYGLYLLKD